MSAKLFLQAVQARTYPRLAWLYRSNSWMIQETVLPVLAVSAFAYAYRAMEAPQAYTGFLVLGAAMTTFWLNVLWGMGAQLYWERDSGNLELYVMSPAPMVAILTGMALGGMTTTIIRATAITVAGVLLFDVPINPSSWWLLALGFVVTLAALYGLGMLFASVFLMWGREAWHLIALLQEPIYLMSGTNFPVSVLPRAVAVVASAIPLTLGMDAMRQVLFRVNGLFDVWTELSVLGSLAVVFFFVARWSLRRLERRAREEGKLTVRWQ
ncbi:abc transporter : Transport permease protein OS=Candidatus Acetothermus autotrophicum GN=HGMM_OP2C038 PE=3 SV=1: ABC2_membrane [Gemmata massiliana]|uniref:Transport permease protein n=1 Tax=Gemmata massiliana TaxID=1210884 RepID=A0A6P2DN54_9BACT|nr:ABC transporter permease [Gemmata massiliana]VTS03447.1 abc transporter : Transport permease protein OS=Candidatus Acetothermus autotrophicum GN=HGMM_OP2C038 PE=3 SV=1: ABC2_membrane [Gemmata massiliana]